MSTAKAVRGYRSKMRSTVAGLILLSIITTSCSPTDAVRGPHVVGQTEPPSCSGRRVAEPRWVPHDMPFPKGTFTFKRLERRGGFYRALFVIPLDLKELAAFLLARWPKAGYTLGPGDTELGLEIEDTFEKPTASGVFIASNHCDPGTTVLNLIFSKDGRPTFPLGNRGDPLFPDELRKASPSS